MRRAVYEAITGDSTLNLLGVNADSVFSASAIDSNTPVPRPFLAIRWGGSPEGIGKQVVRTFTVWVHDEPADYSVIDGILLRLKDLLTEIVAVSDQDGGRVDQVSWLGDSEDLSDDAQGTITRNGTYQAVGSLA